MTSAKEASIVALIIVGLISLTTIALEWYPQLSIILAIAVLLGYGRLKKHSFTYLKEGMAEGVNSGIGAIYLFFFIGLLVAALMMAGTIPSIIYYGLSIISPEFFYLSAFVITSIIGVAIGSSLTTCATLGVVFIGMAPVFQAELPIVAGAVVSGAFFGDKMSPLSDTTTIAASIVQIDLFDHIRNMMYTTVPAWFISAVAFWLFSSGSAEADFSKIELLKTQLESTGLIHWYALLPFALLLLLVLRKVNAIYAIISTIVLSIALAYLHHRYSLADLGRFFYAGFKPENPEALGDVARLVSRGGLENMYFSLTIVVLALSLGGLLQRLGILPALLQAVSGFLSNTARATFLLACTSLGINVLVGEQYLSLLLAGNTFKPVYDKLGLHPKNIARTVEDAGTVINPLVPWSVCGVFISQMLGVSVVAYLPYALFCYLCLLLTLVFGFTGVSLSKK